MKLLGYVMDAALALVLLGLMCAFAGVEALTGGGKAMDDCRHGF